MKNVIKGYERASLLDLAILAGGSLDCLFDFAVANSQCITDDVVIGQHYNAVGQNQADTYALTVLNNERVRPATAINAVDVAACPCGGVGFMGIEIDFEVS